MPDFLTNNGLPWCQIAAGLTESLWAEMDLEPPNETKMPIRSDNSTNP
jgi:hypothetical protein